MHFPPRYFQCLKDHKCAEAISLTRKSNKSVVKKAAERQGFEIENVALMEGSNYSDKPAQLVLTSNLDQVSRNDVVGGITPSKIYGPEP